MLSPILKKALKSSQNSKNCAMPSLTSNLYGFGEFSLDPRNRMLRRGGQTVPLTPKAFEVLLLLIQNAGRIVTKDELMKAVWTDSFVEESNLTQTIFMVRKALEETADRRYILTVQGQGYRFLVPVTETGLKGRRSNAGVAVPMRQTSPKLNRFRRRDAQDMEGERHRLRGGSACPDLGVRHLAVAFAAWPAEQPAESCWQSCPLKISRETRVRIISAMG